MGLVHFSCHCWAPKRKCSNIIFLFSFIVWCNMPAECLMLIMSGWCWLFICDTDEERAANDFVLSKNILLELKQFLDNRVWNSRHYVNSIYFLCVFTECLILFMHSQTGINYWSVFVFNVSQNSAGASMAYEHIFSFFFIRVYDHFPSMLYIIILCHCQF